MSNSLTVYIIKIDIVCIFLKELQLRLKKELIRWNINVPYDDNNWIDE